jgi:hypothetical protein
MALRFRKRVEASDRGRRDALIRLMRDVRALLSGQDDAVISVSDHDCLASGCCGTPQTTILVLRPDQPTRAFRIDKPITAVTRPDLCVALAPLLGRDPAPASA